MTSVTGIVMNPQLATEQTLRYAEGLRELYARERAQRNRAERALDQLGEAYGATVVALSVALELRDDQTGGHAERVTRIALDLAQAVAPDLAPEPELEYGFLLHDLGKIGIPDAILLKPGPLTDDERAVIRSHPGLGERIVTRIPFLGALARDVIACHHERWDGSGYPGGLAGEEIPLPARMFAFADSWDAMTNDRPYRAALTFEAAAREIEAGRGGQFDPELVDPFLELVSRRRAA
ncbi:MAG: HD-GYP domain-containing protein [Gaiellaceae bacterium]